ncbi:MAG TPA: GNAT family N-acetyltransferase [Phototrophicaceae bacterium]|nr:GNAT family N-acetyltransferase [Phototrophicaceae bacterium]
MEVHEIMEQGWPPYLLFDPIADKYWTRMHVYFPQFQFALYDQQQKMAAVGNSVPLAWDGRDDSLPPEGWDWVLESGIQGYETGTPPNTLAAISITTSPAYRGQGVSQHAVSALHELAKRNGLAAVIAPVRPNRKHQYPLTPMERYLTWQTDDGAPFDPWMRVHWRLGARIVKVCPRSMCIPGSLAQWEEWTGLQFPESGSYIVPGALNPIEMNLDNGLGCYIEPNVWMVHSL